ncbi:MAG: GNAT family N-acetyltransferase [Deltaproteobacteria bacterium]
MTWLDAAAWDAALEPGTDVYFTHAYHALHAADGVQPSCFAADRLLVPGLRTAIPNSDRADVQTCNGYGGPLGATDAPAWVAWREAARADRIVAALFRLHPLVATENLLPPDAEIRHERATVFVDLKAGLDAAWRAADGRHRNMVQRARREATAVAWDASAWPEFVAMYRAAMDRLAAPEALRFSDEYFTRLQTYRPAQLASLHDDRGLVAAAVMLWGPRWGHYHLAARREDAPNYAANIVVQAALERAAELGLQGVHLGGGTTNAPDDSLLRFKRSLGGKELAFRVARVIADPPAFDELVARRGGSPTWLLGYRQPG